MNIPHSFQFITNVADIQQRIVQAEEQLANLKKARQDAQAEFVVAVQQTAAQMGIKRFLPRQSNKSPSKPKYTSKHPAKYKNPDPYGRDWSGKGKVPAWIKGKNYDDFLIVPATALDVTSTAAISSAI
jgi:DNA-binding protein H-NS